MKSVNVIFLIRIARFTIYFLVMANFSCLQINAQANLATENYRPPLFLREDWKETPAATPVTQQHVSNSDLLLHLYTSIPTRSLFHRRELSL